MQTTKPIKSYVDVQKFKNYYLEKGEYRNYLLVTVCLNTALRISDVLELKWEDFLLPNSNRVKKYISIKEKKTGKSAEIIINSNIKKTLKLYMSKSKIKNFSGYIFSQDGSKPITRTQAYRIITNGGKSVGLDISCHSLRKTFGYHAWKKGVPSVLLMGIYNHSSFEITKRYLGIDQDDKDRVYKSIAL